MGDVQAQVMPDSQVYTMAPPAPGSMPTPAEYALAFDAVNKNVVSPNNGVFLPVPGAAGVKKAEPIQVTNTVIKEVAKFDFVKTAVLVGAAFFAYKLFFKGKH